ncbi:hypothetical protein BK659_12395 [Pseudomonas brassicacearum]|uniref:Uncharacterized protein n=1 Tax=Pseudomonas brassicacearum TaxID=930166 RepID=A0A423H775_9PSED|nr:hypothetical protein [Pseudomonas brassicacearum]RON09038.1 hypothetical protein BK659_12395 [Pseudomonas brassicacearum]
MHLTLFIKSVLLLMLLNGAAVSSAQAASLVYKSSCMSNAGENLGPQPGMLIEEHAGGVLFIFRNSIDVPSPLSDGNAIGFHTDFSGDSHTQSIAPKGALNNGVNALGKWVSFLGPCANASSFNSLIAALANGQFRVGRHVQGIGLAGTANSYINQRSAVPLPAAAWLFSSALFGFIVFANRRKV